MYCVAQDSIPELITDRPDQTESSVVVPLRSLQIETGSLTEHDHTEYAEHRVLAYNSTLLRYGLFRNMELRLGLNYLGDVMKMTGNDSMIRTSGFSPFYAGFKIKIREEQDWVPAIAFLGAIILPFTASEAFRPDHPASEMRFSFSNTLSDRFSLGYNIGVEWDGETMVPDYYYTVSLAIGLSECIGAFVESYGYIPEEGSQEHLADTGITWLIMSNLQIDFSAGTGISKAAPDNFIGLGITYRLPE